MRTTLFVLMMVTSACATRFEPSKNALSHATGGLLASSVIAGVSGQPLLGPAIGCQLAFLGGEAYGRARWGAPPVGELDTVADWWDYQVCWVDWAWRERPWWQAVLISSVYVTVWVSTRCWADDLRRQCR